MKNIILIFFLFTFNLFAYLNIYPVHFDKFIDKSGNNQDFTLYNKTQNSIRYNISLSDENIKNSMKNWVEFYPKTLTIKPGKKEKIKVYIKAPKGTPKGEYLTTLEIKETIVPNLQKKDEKNTIQILTHLKMDIAGYVGDIRPKLDVISKPKLKIKENMLSIEGKIRNNGERRGKIQLILSNGKKTDEYVIGNLRILKNEEVDLTTLSHEVLDKDKSSKLKKYKKLIIRDQDNNEDMLEVSI